MIISTKSTLRYCCALGALLWPLAAQAQSTPADHTRATTDAPATTGEAAPSDHATRDIIVTGQRRAQRLEEVPASISVVTSGSIERSAVTSLLDISSLAPGVKITFAGTATQTAIRGITSLTNTGGFENNVAVYVDGFYQPDMGSINTDLGNVASIEVLKGPQGTLYGRNATGGAILIRTLEPSKTFTGRLDLSYATYNDGTISGYLSGPITDRVRFSVAGYLRKTDGYIRLVDPLRIGATIGDAFPMRQQNVRAKLAADITNNLTATLMYNHALSDDPRGVKFTPIAHTPPGYPAPPLRATAWNTASYNYDAVNKTTTDELNLVLALATGIGKVTSFTGYGVRKNIIKFDFDGTYSDTVFGDYADKFNTFQQTVDFVIDKIRGVDLVVGANYFYNNFRSVPPYRLTDGPGRVPNFDIRPKIVTNAYAVYVDATIHLNSALSISPGGRFSYEKKSTSNQRVGTSPFGPIFDEAAWSKFTPSLAIRYELARKTNIYASYSQGFRSGTFPVTISAANQLVPIRPETLTAYEVGFKTVQRTFRLDLAAFYYDDRNYHVGVQVPVCVGTICTSQARIANAPKARIYGLEGQLEITPVDRLNFRIGGTYLHARYVDFTNATGTGLNIATNRNISQTQDWSDQQMARAPTLSGNLGADYTLDLFGGDLLLSANVDYSDSYVPNNPSLYGPLAGADLANKQRLRTGPYALINGQIQWKDSTGRYSIAVFGRNLTNKRYLLAYNAGTNGDYFTEAWPRQVGVKVRYQF